MAARSKNLRIGSDVGIFDKRDGIAVQGYVRSEFAERYWIDEIIGTIIQFYMNKGGSLYVCGQGQHGKLGLKEYCGDKLCKEPAICPPFYQNNCSDIATGWDHTLALEIDGNVWVCGQGKYGALGNGKTSNVEVMTMLSLSDRAIAVSVGMIS